MENEKLENLLLNINENAQIYSYVQIASMLQELTNDELDELEDMSMISCSTNVFEKIQKATRLIRLKRQNSGSQSIDSIANIVNKLDSVPIEQLLHIKIHLEAKEQLNQLESNFLTMLNNKINERGSKKI